VVEKTSGGDPASVAWQGTPYGPSGTADVPTKAVQVSRSQFTRTAADVGDYLRKHGRIPTTVWLGSAAATPEMYLQTLAQVVVALVDGKPLSEILELTPAELIVAKHVADDGPNLWGWVIFPRSFRAPAMMALAKRQTWTLKPALLQGKLDE
jgi:hypothetical protein